MSVEDSESRYFGHNIRLVFPKPILAQHRPQNSLFWGFPKVWNFRFEQLCSIASCTRKIRTGIFGIQYFHGIFAFPLSLKIKTFPLKKKLLIKKVGVIIRSRGLYTGRVGFYSRAAYKIIGRCESKKSRPRSLRLLWCTPCI